MVPYSQCQIPNHVHLNIISWIDGFIKQRAGPEWTAETRMNTLEILFHVFLKSILTIPVSMG